ncbi:transglycosylase domain-containing protein [Halalkalibacterium ligniniphilum]|uniref:transglycosylase domain-containing protein n=1 Tax=Halalkalibacterium ligniniphilum TaxID=1134413 RepID=UPI000475C21A
MRASTGWLLTILCFIGVSFLFIEVVAEVQQVQTFSEVVDEHVNLDTITLSTNSQILAGNGELISEVYRDQNRIYLPYDKIPAHIINAFIATEDRRFFEHQGYDATSIVRALMTNLRSESIEQGGSTVTQQLVRNVFLSHEQTYQRKISELLYAYELEKHYTKEEIIELYINSIYFQHGVYGFEAASIYYFNRPSNELSLAEIAFLSAIPNNPTHYDPLRNKESTKLRQEWILEKMLEVDAISQEEYFAALEEPITLNIHERVDRFPDYVTYVHEEFKQLVAASEGFNTRLAEASTEDAKEEINASLNERVNELLQSGITIQTALDPAMQLRTRDSVTRRLPQADIQGAAVVIDHTTNEVIAITAGKNYSKFDFHRGFQSYRQPGSAIKPLLVYGPYFEEKEIPIHSTINADNFCSGNYCPKNFGGAQYGNVSLETAFKHSLNTPAVRILERVGVETAFKYLESFHFQRLTEKDYGLYAALGGFTYGMTPLELTSAYTTFGNNGVYQKPFAIREVTDRNGEVLYKWEVTPATIWSQETNDKMRTLLASVVQSGTGTKANVNSSYVGGKTGTTNDYLDLWFVGLTEQYTAGVWVGKDKPANLQSIYSQTPSQLIWRDIMSQ